MTSPPLPLPIPLGGGARGRGCCYAPAEICQKMTDFCASPHLSNSPVSRASSRRVSPRLGRKILLRTHFAKVNRLEAEFERRRIRFQGEIIFLRRDKERVGNNGMHVVTAAAPLFERCLTESH